MKFILSHVPFILNLTVKTALKSVGFYGPRCIYTVSGEKVSLLLYNYTMLNFPPEVVIWWAFSFKMVVIRDN